MTFKQYLVRALRRKLLVFAPVAVYAVLFFEVGGNLGHL